MEEPDKFSGTKHFESQQSTRREVSCLASSRRAISCALSMMEHSRQRREGNLLKGMLWSSPRMRVCRRGAWRVSNSPEDIRKSSFSSAGRSFGMNSPELATRERHLVECCLSRMAMGLVARIFWVVRVTSKGALFEYRSEQVSRADGSEDVRRFHQPNGHSIFIVDHSVGVCVTRSRHDEQTLVRSHGVSSLSGIGPDSRWPNTDRSNSGGRRRMGACKEWYLSRVGLMTATSARRRAISDSSSWMRSNRG